MSNKTMEHSTYSLHKANIVDNVIVDCGNQLKPAIQGMLLFKCTIINSILRDCALSNCTLLSCTIINSKLDNCTIRQDIQTSLYRDPFYLKSTDPQNIPPTHTRKPSLLRNCETKDCAITNSVISRDSKVHGGRLASCEVQYSTIGKAMVCETLILKSKVHNCSLYYSNHHGCNMSRTANMGCKALSTLRVFPPEIRSVIFKHSMMLDGPLPTQMPALITALRPDQTLYYEALDVLRNDSCFSVFVEASEIDIFTTSKSQVEYVRKVILRYQYFPIRVTLWHT